ncbi:hypothetical protein [Streptomyces sp. NPDC059862]|uniref:hypothetical protein n=1 Tax=unclassified Streptomyces TaxID=2593676 RepID=UPI0036283EA4
MLRSVLVAAFSAVVAFGTLSGLSSVKSDASADGVRSASAVSSVTSGGGDTTAFPADTVWD